jgi:tripartite-type tricarboxylate transporter receptor subunit TctC
VFAVPHIQSRKVRALAVTHAVRLEALPDVPTLAEAALPGYDVYGWYAFHAPAGTRRETVDTANTALRKVIAMQDVRAKLAMAGVDPERNSPEEMADMMKAGVARFGKIIRDAGIKPE